MTTHRFAAIAIATCILCLGCGRADTPAPAAATPGPAAPVTVPESFRPGLGEIMTLQQMRHTKLWFAGQAGNWPLASYELNELGEGFDDIVAFHPVHEDAPVAPKDAVP